MYKRFFAFGCSFTHYHWPTWADIVAYSYPTAEYYNYGRAGAGNQVAFSRIMECDERYKFNENDLVMVQWSNCARQDMWKDQHWIGYGNIYSGSKYSDDFLTNYASDPYGYTLRDLGYVKAVNHLLASRNVVRFNLSMCSFLIPDQYNYIKNRVDFTQSTLITENYKDVLASIRPGFFETVFKSDWFSRYPRPQTLYQGTEMLLKDDQHPTPLESLEYLRTVVPELGLDAGIDSVVKAANDQVMSRLNKSLEPVYLGDRVKRTINDDYYKNIH